MPVLPVMPVMPVMPIMSVMPIIPVMLVMPVMPVMSVCLNAYISVLFYTALMPLFLHYFIVLQYFQCLLSL